MSRLVLLMILLAAAPGAAAAEYAVGTSTETYIDADRGGRAVGVDLYYPAPADGAGQPLAAPPAGGFPVVAFGHGYLMGSSLYAWLGDGLARQGCIVAVARTGGELFPDHLQFGQDLAFLTRALRAAGDDDGSPFFGGVAARCAVAGHSMGGGSSLLGAADDPGVSAVFGLAPAETSPSAIAAAAQAQRPLLIIAGAADCVTPPADHQVPMYEAAGDWRVLVTLDGASHCQFTAESTICSFGESCSANITRAAQQQRTLDLLEPWIRGVLMGDSGGVTAFHDLLESAADLVYQEDGAPAAAAVGAGAAGGLRLIADGPGPFTSELALRLEGAPAGFVSFAVHDVRGMLVRRWTVAADGARDVRTAWNGRDEHGRRVAGGVYLVKARAADRAVVLRTVRLR